MVVTCKHHYPAISPLPCFAQCYHAQKRGVIAGFYGINGGVMFARKSSSYVGIMQSRFIGDTVTSHGGMLDPWGVILAVDINFIINFSTIQLHMEMWLVPASVRSRCMDLRCNQTHSMFDIFADWSKIAKFCTHKHLATCMCYARIEH